MPTREELVVAARQGDTAAFAALIEMDGPGGLRLARAIVAQPADAEDALQEALLRTWRELPRLRDPTRWSAWFRRIVVRCALDSARRRGRVKEIALGGAMAHGAGRIPAHRDLTGNDLTGHTSAERQDAGPAQALPDPSAWGGDPAATVAERDLAWQALARLDPEDRALLALRFLADLEVPDAAAALGLRLGTAKSRLHRLLARLRQELEAER